MKTGNLVVAIYTLFFLAACAALTPPPVDPPQPGVFKCTEMEHYCTRSPVACCGNGYDCGGSVEFPGCQAGDCCANGGADSPVDSFGNRRRTKQRTQ